MTATALERVVDGVRLHVVTGKGGVGKTTVSGALAVALARRGQHVLLVEVEGRQGISQTFGVGPLGTEEVRLLQDSTGGELWGLSVDAKAALMEYLQMYYKLGRAGGALERMGVVDFATTIAPGVRDVLLTGKVYEAFGRSTGRHRGQGDPVWDAIVLDAPPTGRVGRFLAVNEQVADLARVGPIHTQAQAITAMMRDPATCVHLVTLLEEMPVQESVEAVRDLGAGGFRMGAIVVNQVREPLVDPALLEWLATDPQDVAEQVRADLARVGTRSGPTTVTGLLTQGRAHGARVALERDLAAEVAAQGLPTLTLPALSAGTEDGGVSVLADVLAEQDGR